MQSYEHSGRHILARCDASVEGFLYGTSLAFCLQVVVQLSAS
jgi:hypothetical protein